MLLLHLKIHGGLGWGSTCEVKQGVFLRHVGTLIHFCCFWHSVFLRSLEPQSKSKWACPMFLSSICMALLKPHRYAPQCSLVDTARWPPGHSSGHREAVPRALRWTPRGSPQVTPVNTVRLPHCSPTDTMCLSRPAQV